jgi:hypothetical protein
MTRNIVCVLIAAVVFAHGCSEEEATSKAEAGTPPPTIAPTSTDAPTPTSTVAPTTVAPTTTLATPTVESLFFMMPGPADLPSGWTTPGGMPSAALEPATGPGQGACGGPNLDQRAQDAGVVAVMTGQRLQTGDGGEAQIAVYAFKSSNDARALMDSTMAQTQCPFYEYTLTEGSTPGFFDGFAAEFGDGRASWTIRENVSVAAVEIDGVSSAFLRRSDVENSTTYRGVAYGDRSSSLDLYEQHDRFVFVSTLFGECCAYGYGNAAATIDYNPTTEALLAGVEVIRPKVVGRLREALLL